MAGGVAQGVGPEFKPHHCKKRREKKKKDSVHYLGVRGRRIAVQDPTEQKLMTPYLKIKKARCGGTDLWSQLLGDRRIVV
jgi:hypothetical protein